MKVTKSHNLYEDDNNDDETSDNNNNIDEADNSVVDNKNDNVIILGSLVWSWFPTQKDKNLLIFGRLRRGKIWIPSNVVRSYVL